MYWKYWGFNVLNMERATRNFIALLRSLCSLRCRILHCDWSRVKCATGIFDSPYHIAPYIQRTPNGCPLYIWSGRRESNPRIQLGKLVFCHWTTPASQRYYLYHIAEAKATPATIDSTHAVRNHGKLLTARKLHTHPLGEFLYRRNLTVVYSNNGKK